MPTETTKKATWPLEFTTSTASEEKRRSARRLRKETTRATQQVDDCDDEDADFDLQGIQEDAIIGIYQLSLVNNSRKRSRHKRLKLSFSFFAFFTNY